MPSIAEKIINIRSQAGLSRAKFSESIGFSKSYLADIETGRTMPSRNVLEAIRREYGTSIDWLLEENPIIQYIEANKETENPDIIFLYAFTQAGIDEAEKDLRELLEGYNYILIDAYGIKSAPQLFRKLLNIDGRMSVLWDRLKEILLNGEVVLVLKNMSKSKIPERGDYIRSIFKILDDAWDIENAGETDSGGFVMPHKMPPSSIVVLDFPSFLEKNMDNFGYYAMPIYVGRDRFPHKR